MKLQNKIIVYLLAGMLLLSGCAVNNAKNNAPSKAEVPEPVERTIVLEEIGIQAENVSPYEGIYIEQGDDENKDRVTGVYALTITNTAEKTIQDAHLVFSDGYEELNFYFQMLPYGSTVTVVEYDKKTVKSGDLQLVDSEINYLQEGLEDIESFKLLESKYGSIIVENLIGQNLQKAEIYYRRSYEDGTLGGMCYVEVLEDVGTGDIVYADPEYWGEYSAIVNILIYPNAEDATDGTGDEIYPETN